MTTKNLKRTPLRDLLALQKRVAAAIAVRRQQMAKAKARIMAIAAKLGVSTRELASLARGRGPDKAPRKTKGKPAPVKATRGRAAKNGDASHAVH